MKTTPIEHQEKAMKIVHEDCFGLFWEMGLGKTWMGCWLLEKDLNTKGFQNPFLIVAPNSVVQNWVEEIKIHAEIPETAIALLHGSKENRLKLLNDSKYLIYIINYEGLLVLKDLLPKRIFRMVILDESHCIKNPKAQTTKVACSIKADRRYIMSGTPVLNNYMDVFSQWLFLDGGKTFGRNFFIFRNTYFTDLNIGRYRGNFPDWKLKPGMEEKLKALMANKSHRLEKKDCLKLPEKIYKTEYCYMTAEQMKHYKELKQEFITFIEEQAVPAPVMLTRLLRLNQLTSGYLKTADDKEVKLKTNPKMDLCKQMVSEILIKDENGKYINNNKIIIWARFVHDIEMLIDAFIEHNPAMVYGAIEDKQPQIKKFQEDDTCRVFVGQIASGIGITLTKANYTIYYSSDFNLGHRLQSEDRNHRKGSEMHENITYIDLIMKDTIDEYIVSCVKKKKDMSTDIMDYIKNFKREGVSK